MFLLVPTLCIIMLYVYEKGKCYMLKGIEMKRYEKLAALTFLMLGIVFAMCMVMAGGCQPSQDRTTSAWFFGDEELTSIRLGVYTDEQTEVGGVALWTPSEGKNVDLYGVYGLHYFDAVKTAPPFRQGSEELLSAVPYVGIQSIFDLDYDAHVFTVTGLVFEDIFFVEHQYDISDNQESKTMIGVKFRF